MNKREFLNQFTITTLQSVCAKLNLSTSGKKDDVIQRLCEVNNFNSVRNCLGDNRVIVIEKKIPVKETSPIVVNIANTNQNTMTKDSFCATSGCGKPVYPGSKFCSISHRDQAKSNS